MLNFKHKPKPDPFPDLPDDGTLKGVLLRQVGREIAPKIGKKTSQHKIAALVKAIDFVAVWPEEAQKTFAEEVATLIQQSR